MVPFTGFDMPVQYTGIVDEHQAVRNACGIFDVSHMGELEMRGEYAGQVVDYLITNDASKLVDGQALYTCACNEQGTILDDLIIYRAAQDRWLIVCNASNHDKMVAVFEKAAKDHCEFEDRTDKTALIALQGPKAFDVLALAGGDAAKLVELKSFHFRDAVVAASGSASSVSSSSSSAPSTSANGTGRPCHAEARTPTWSSVSARPS